MDILGRPPYVRVLMLLRKRGPSRFSEIEEALGLNPKTVDEALKDLRRGLWVVPRTGEDDPGERVVVRYGLSNRGQALLELLDDLQDSARKRERSLGSDAVDELDALLA